MRIIDKLSYSQNWNIGFCEQTYDNLLQTGSLNKIRWMKHPYKDRWFADPFIYKITSTDIIVFVEECPIENPKGILCELVLNRDSLELKERYVLLELETHLSYPAIFKIGNKTYVYPENGASGALNIYEYDELGHRLINPVCVLSEGVADSTILQTNEGYYIIATKFPKTQECAYIYKSDTLFGPYALVTEEPINKSLKTSRPAGNWFYIGEQLYRPAQNCSKLYGGSISLMSASLLPYYSESLIAELHPSSFQYNLRLHTINGLDGYLVIDGAGYSYPLIGRIIEGLRTLKHKFK